MKRVSSEILSVNVTGYLLPYRNGQPQFLKIEGKRFICLFTTKEKLEQAMQEIGVKDYQIKEITDGDDFLASVKGYMIAIDPYRHGDNTRFIQILNNGL